MALVRLQSDAKQKCVIEAEFFLPEEFDILKGLIIGLNVTGVYLDGKVNTLVIDLEKSTKLIVISEDSVYENWYIFRRPDDMVVSGPGTDWAEWIPED